MIEFSNMSDSDVLNRLIKRARQAVEQMGERLEDGPDPDNFDEDNVVDYTEVEADQKTPVYVRTADGDVLYGCVWELRQLVEIADERDLATRG